MKFRRIQNVLCIGVVGVIVLVWVFSGQSPSVAVSKNLGTKIDRQVVVLDAGHGAYALTVVA